MPERDFYEILGVSRDATPEQIKKAYRTLARKNHPDVNPGDKQAEARFKEIQSAYDVLGDTEKRALYDRYGKAAFEGAAAAGPRAKASEWTYRFGTGQEGDFVDLSEFFGPGFGAQAQAPGGEAAGAGGVFDDLLGRLRGGRAGRRPSGPRKGRALEATLTIPFDIAVGGGETSIEVDRGTGRHETLVVKIPPGTEPGARLRLKGQGEPGPAGTQPGDLLITVEVGPHRYFTRQGRDLYLDLPISLSEAVLGAKVDVPTLAGTKTLPVPPGSSTGQKLRLRGMGVPASGKSPAGDLFAVIRVAVPKSVDDQSKALIQEFAERNPLNPRAGLW